MYFGDMKWIGFAEIDQEKSCDQSNNTLINYYLLCYMTWWMKIFYAICDITSLLLCYYSYTM